MSVMRGPRDRGSMQFFRSIGTFSKICQLGEMVVAKERNKVGLYLLHDQSGFLAGQFTEWNVYIACIDMLSQDRPNSTLNQVGDNLSLF